MPKYDVIAVPMDGNAFSIMASVKAAMLSAGAPRTEVDEYLKDAMSGDYDHLLQASLRMVDLGTGDGEDIEDDEDEDYCGECSQSWKYCDC
jgi:hypothetical protein